MPFWQFRAVIDGYQNQIDNMAANSIWTGFWSAYYNSTSKLKKSPQSLIKALRKKATKAKQQHVDNVDVDAFLERERKFNEQLGR